MYNLVFEGQTVGGGRALNASVGAVLGGRYRIHGTLGAGGMAVVYEAEDAILGRRVALKTLHRHYAEEVSFRLRFKQEARVMASLDHENVVKVYDISQEGEIPFIVAEYVGGQDVGSMLKNAPKGRLGEQATEKIATQLLKALDYAHRRGVVHRDVKPSNILLTEDEIVKVADFGIARIIEEEDVGEPGQIIGSARYMSPEQLRGEETTPRSDLYSAGILLYHCLTGRPPFSGDAESVARCQIHEEPAPPSKLNRAISAQAEAVVLKALSKDPADRYPSAAAMLEDLRKTTGTTPASAWETAESRRRARGKKKRRAHWRFGVSRKALLASSALALLLFTGTGLLAGGYTDPASLPLPWQTGAALVPVQPGTEEAGENPTPLEASGAASPEEPEEETPPLEAQAPEAEPVPVPNVDAYFDYFAEQTLAASGFDTEFAYGYREGYATAGVTWGTDPAAGTPLPPGSTVTVYVTPKNQPQVPQLPVPAPVPPAQNAAPIPISSVAPPPPQPQVQPPLP